VKPFLVMFDKFDADGSGILDKHDLELMVHAAQRLVGGRRVSRDLSMSPRIRRRLGRSKSRMPEKRLKPSSPDPDLPGEAKLQSNPSMGALSIAGSPAPPKAAPAPSIIGTSLGQGLSKAGLSAFASRRSGRAESPNGERSGRGSRKCRMQSWSKDGDEVTSQSPADDDIGDPFHHFMRNVHSCSDAIRENTKKFSQ